MVSAVRGKNHEASIRSPDYRWCHCNRRCHRLCGPHPVAGAEDIFEAENDARATLAQIIGGFAVLIGLYFAWKNITAAKEGQATERFTKAIEQLGATDDDGNTVIAAARSLWKPRLMPVSPL